MQSNAQKLQSAVTLALADSNFLSNDTKVNKAIEALTPKSTVTAVLKRLQGNARLDFLDKKDEGAVGYTDESKAFKIREYVLEKFRPYMEDPKTSEEATRIFNAAYPCATTEPSADDADQQTAGE